MDHNKSSKPKRCLYNTVLENLGFISKKIGELSSILN